MSSSFVEIKTPLTLGGESIVEGSVRSIKRAVGDTVKVDDLMFEIETDKTILELTAPAEGVVAEINVKVGDVVGVEQVIAKLQVGVVTQTVMDSDGKDSLKVDKKDSPAACKIMREENIDPSSVKGSGKGGRVMKQDVLCVAPAVNDDKTKTIENAVQSSGNRETKVGMSKIRQVIAKRLKDSQNTAATLTTFNEIDMKNVMSVRNKYKEAFEVKHGIKLGYMSFFVKAVVLALKVVPEVNAEIRGTDIVYKNYYDIGVAVGTDEGLVVPVIRDVDILSFAQIEKKITEFGVKAKSGKLSIAELSGATFTISNGGVYGSLLSTPIINPPQSGILGMHATKNRPVAIDDKVEIRPMMYVALSYDHRIVDGKGAITFLSKVKDLIEDPERLLLDV